MDLREIYTEYMPISITQLRGLSEIHKRSVLASNGIHAFKSYQLQSTETSLNTIYKGFSA